MIEINSVKMREFLRSIFDNYSYMLENDSESFSLSLLDNEEIDAFIFNAVGYFEFYTALTDWTEILGKLQICLKTKENVDKIILADEFKKLIFFEFEESMQDLLNREFLTYKMERENEKLLDAGCKKHIDKENGEVNWYK